MIGSEALCPLALVGVSDKGLFSCADTETAACALLGEGLVKVSVGFLERGGIEAACEHRSPSDDVLPCL